MDIRNGLISAYNGISASLGTSNAFDIYKSTTGYVKIFNNSRAWFGSGTPVDGGYQMDIGGTARIQGPIYATFGANSLNIISNTATGTQTADRGILIGAASSFTGSSIVSTALGHSTVIGAGTGNLALGFGTNASNAGIAIGGPGGAGAVANNGIAIGGGATSIGGIAIGGGTTLNNSAAVAIGFYISSIGVNAIAIGPSAFNSGSYAVAIGDRATIPANHIAAIALGLFARSTAARQLVIGGNDISSGYSINDVYIGGGVQDLNNSNATSVTINASGGGNATNTTGGNIRIAGGKGTGNAVPGDVIFSTSTTGSSGTTLQTLVDRWYIKGQTGTLTNKNISYSGSTAIIDVTGSVIITGSLFMSPSSSFILPLSASSAPQTGSAYWSGSLLFIWNGTRYMSSSFA